MSEIPNDLKYTRSHEWARLEEDGTVTVGITDHAQSLLGDLVFVELPKMGQPLDIEEQCGVVESVKAASEIFSPIAGEVLEINDALIEQPELVNSSPFEDGWLFKMKPDDHNSGWDSLLSPEHYAEMAEE